MAWRHKGGGDKKDDNPASKFRRGPGGQKRGANQDEKDEEQTGGGGWHQGGGGRASGSRADTVDTMMMQNMQKLTLNTSQRQRQTEAATLDTFMLPAKLTVIKGTQKAGMAYNLRVQDQPGSGHGSPHVFKAAAFVEALAQVKETPEVHRVLFVALDKFMDNEQGPKLTNDLFPHFRVKIIKSKGAGKGKNRDRDEDDDAMDDEDAKALLSIGFNPLPLVKLENPPLEGAYLALAIRRAIMGSLEAMSPGAHCEGQGPATHIERLVQDDLKKLQKR